MIPMLRALAHNAKVDRTNLFIEDATDIYLPFDYRCRAFDQALALWPEGSFERSELMRRYGHVFQPETV